jgi:hypothetical protein
VSAPWGDDSDDNIPYSRFQNDVENKLPVCSRLHFRPNFGPANPEVNANQDEIFHHPSTENARCPNEQELLHLRHRYRDWVLP